MKDAFFTGTLLLSLHSTSRHNRHNRKILRKLLMSEAG